MMKLLSGAVPVILISLFISCSGNGRNTVKEAVSQDPAKVEVMVAGMTCTGCEQTISKNVGGLEGVKSVSASHTEGKALVEYLPALVDTTEIKDAITRSGYTVIKCTLQ